MSFPAPSMPNTPLKGGGAMVNPLDVIVGSINSNPYFIGLMMLCLNLGGRFIALEVTKTQEQFLQNPWVRRSLIFAMIFMGTRNIMVALWMTLVIVLCIGYLFNENSSLCIYKAGLPDSTCGKKETEGLTNTAAVNNGGVTVEEMDIYKKLHEKISKAQPVAEQKETVKETFAQNTAATSDNEKEEDFTRTYFENIQLLKNGEGFRVGRF